MVQRQYMRLIIMIFMSLVISLPIWASGEEVGNFTRVERRVDYQRGGTGPITPAEVKKPVEVKDVINTYELSRAQVQFRDKSMIIIAPQSKVAIENYMFDPAKFERNGQFDLIQGVMKVVVPAGEKLQKSSITIKTSTAIMGIRGTEFVAISGTNFSVVYVTKGRVCLKANPKEPGKYTVRYVAPGEALEKGEVCLDPDTMSVILNNQPPTRPQPVTAVNMAAVEGLVTSGISTAPGVCVLSALPGVNLVNVANDLISQGADPKTVKESLNQVCFVMPESLTYSPPEAVPAEVGASFPGGGGGGGGGGQASPSS
jgi:hypothetical protein